MGIRRALLKTLVRDRATKKHSLLHAISRRHSREHYKTLSKHVKGKRVLDIGAGHGDGYSYLLAAKPKKVVAIEPSEEAAAGFRHKEGVELHNIALEQNTFKDASFDVITCSGTMFHVPAYGVFLREVRRLLKPGGRFIVSTLDVDVMKRYFGIELRNLSPDYAELFTAEGFGEILRQAFGSEPELFIQVPVRLHNILSFLSMPLTLPFVRPMVRKPKPGEHGVYNIYTVRKAQKTRTRYPFSA